MTYTTCIGVLQMEIKMHGQAIFECRLRESCGRVFAKHRDRTTIHLLHAVTITAAVCFLKNGAKLCTDGMFHEQNIALLRHHVRMLSLETNER